MVNQLGFISQKYESGNLRSDAISNISGDPGGKSYGLYQLSSRAGTLVEFLNESRYINYFKNTKIGTETFDTIWKQLSKDQDFIQAQYDFIKINHFDPARKYADSFGFLNTPAINETIFSISVQHGKYKEIIRSAARYPGGDWQDEKRQVEALYGIRRAYIQEITLPPQIKRSLTIRYVNEERDVLKLVNLNVIPLNETIKDDQPLPTSCDKMSQDDSIVQESPQTSESACKTSFIDVLTRVLNLLLNKG